MLSMYKNNNVNKTWPCINHRNREFFRQRDTKLKTNDWKLAIRKFWAQNQEKSFSDLDVKNITYYFFVSPDGFLGPRTTWWWDVPQWCPNRPVMMIFGVGHKLTTNSLRLSEKNCRQSTKQKFLLFCALCSRVDDLN